MKCTIPEKADQERNCQKLGFRGGRPLDSDRNDCGQRRAVECGINRLTRHREVAMGSDERAVGCHATVLVAAVCEWLVRCIRCDHVAVNSDLPDGWTIERIRCASGDAEADLLSLERLVVVEQYGSADYDILRPDLILSFHDLCLVRTGDEWFMGHIDSDGSVICWASYGPDLAEAIRGL